jgi:hypothetical protein
VTLLALKLLLAPSFIVATTVLARRAGVRVAGVVGGLPAIAGPILLVLALDRGRAFAGAAATGTLLGIVALVVFVLAYAAVSSRTGWPSALLIGWTSFLAAVLALRPVQLAPLSALALSCAACGATLLVLSRRQSEPSSARPYPRWDLPVRAACTVVPILAVTGAARLLGPHLTGLLAAFPVITPVLTAFTHAQQGAGEAVRLLRGMTLGFFAYALFCFVVSTTVGELGIAVSFALATAVALAAQGAAIALSRGREQLLSHEAAS